MRGLTKTTGKTYDSQSIRSVHGIGRAKPTDHGELHIG